MTKYSTYPLACQLLKVRWELLSFSWNLWLYNELFSFTEEDIKNSFSMISSEQTTTTQVFPIIDHCRKPDGIWAYSIRIVVYYSPGPNFSIRTFFPQRDRKSFKNIQFDSNFVQMSLNTVLRVLWNKYTICKKKKNKKKNLFLLHLTVDDFNEN